MLHDPRPVPNSANAKGSSTGELTQLEPGAEARLRRKILFAGAAVATLLSATFWLVGASKDISSTERVIVPLLTVLFGGVTFMTWRGQLRHAEILLLSVGGGVLLERIWFTKHLDKAGLVPVTDVYELLIWFPCVFAFAFLLLEKREATLFNLALLGASMLVVADWLTPGGPGLYHPDLSEFYIGLLGAVTCLHAFAYLRDSFIDTHRMAVDLRTVAETDFLTGIDNRRITTSNLDREIKRADRAGTPLAVILFDLDRFKRVNDEYGRDEGDRALRRVSFVVDRARRDTDSFGRWGGEEFLIVAPGIDLERGEAAAHRLRELIADSGSETDGIKLTASFGVSGYRFGDDGASLVKRADEALMRAKGAARNQVGVADENEPRP